MHWRGLVFNYNVKLEIFCSLLCIQLTSSIPLPDEIKARLNSKQMLEANLYKLLPIEDQAEIQLHEINPNEKLIRKKRDDYLINQILNDPLENITSLDRFIDSDHTFNLSSAELDFYRTPTYEFHRRIFNRFRKWQKKSFNASMIEVQNAINEHERNMQRNVTAKEALSCVHQGLSNYRNEMFEWMRHSFVYRPKTLVREEKLKLECFLLNATKSIPQDKLRSFWYFERCFANMLGYYHEDMTARVLDHYDQVLWHYIDMRENFTFPRTLDALQSMLDANERLYGIDVRNETTTFSYADLTVFTLDAEQKKAARQQRVNFSREDDKKK